MGNVCMESDGANPLDQHEVDEDGEAAKGLKEGAEVELVFWDRAPQLLEDEHPISAREPVFKTRMDKTRSFIFRRRPLGLTFTRDEAPLVIIGVDFGSEGEAAGVRTGMELMTVAGKDLTGWMYQESFDCLVQALEVLPMRKTAA